MRLTEALKMWLVENKELAKDAEDAAFSKAAAEALVDGSLTDEKFIELNKDPDAEKASALATKLNTLEESTRHTQEALQKLIELQTAKVTPVEETVKPEMKKVESGVTSDVLGNGDKDDDDVTIKHITADKRYDATKKSRDIPMKDHRGRPMPFGGDRLCEGRSESRRPIDDLSELERAVNGAFGKHMMFGKAIAQGLLPKSLITDHDRELVRYACDNMNWGGEIKTMGNDGTGVMNRRLTPSESKTVYDELGTSGGLEIVPIAWDDAIITTPLLHSEFFPRVNVVNIPRGSRIEGANVANLTVTWMANEQTGITLETTAAFVTAFDTTIMDATASIALGLDFLSDTPVNFGDIVTANAGQSFLNSFDDVIVSGDGTSQPTGIQDVGVGSVELSFGGAWSIGNMVSLMLRVGKEYKAATDNNRVCWGAHPTTYADVRGLETGVTGDDRLIFGQGIDDYTVMGHPFLINDTFGATDMVFCNLARYRMYRRLGITARMETGGQTLALANSAIMIFRARLGGQLEDANANAFTTSGPA